MRNSFQLHRNQEHFSYLRTPQVTIQIADLVALYQLNFKAAPDSSGEQSYFIGFNKQLPIAITTMSPLFKLSPLDFLGVCGRPEVKDDDGTSSSGCQGKPKLEGQPLPIVGPDHIMRKKAHGNSEKAVQDKLRWGVDRKQADRICNYNRRFAENSGYWLRTRFLMQANRLGKTTFYDSVTGKPLFTAPVGRSFAEFKKESTEHGWPSFRDAEVHWENVRCLKNGEAVSLTGTHLGHNLPDKKGNRYCINIVSIAGFPEKSPTKHQGISNSEENNAEESGEKSSP